MIGIVGGGISGLFLLHLLRESGIEAILFEASDTPGGVMRSESVAGPDGPVTVDLGPQRIRLTPELSRIVEDLGLTPSIVRARSGVPFTIHHGGHLHPAPTSLGAALRTRLVSWPGKLRALADLVTTPPRPDESVADALRRKLGPEIYVKLAGPILGGLYASDPEEMQVRHTLGPIFERTGARRSLLAGLLRASSGEGLPIVSFTDGLGALPRSLARRHRDHIRIGAPVQSMSAGSGGYRLAWGAEQVEVEQVVLALPAGGASGLLRDRAAEAALRLAELRYNPLAVVPLVVPAGRATPEVGSGFKMTLDDPRATRGVTAHGALFDRRGLFTAFLGGRGREDTVELPDAAILDLAASDFREVTGVEAVPLLVHRTWMPGWDRSWSALDGLELPAGIHLCAAYSSRPGVTGRLENARRIASRLSRR